MKTSKHVFALGSGLLLSLAGVAVAADQSDLTSEVTALKARIAELEQRQSGNWLNERRAEEVKALVRDVLADADTRASLAASGATAGHDGKNFYLADEGGNFRLNVSGQIQVRYVHNFRDDSGSSAIVDDEEVFVTADDNEGGFEIRRAKVQFDGFIGTPKFGYAVQLSAGRNSETVVTDKVVVSYKLMDNVTLYAGEDKAPFLHEEMVSSKYQLAVERSYFNEVFTADRVQGVWATIDAGDMVKLAVAIHDGVRSGEAGDGSKGFSHDSTDIGICARADVKVMGDWADYKDFSSWSSQKATALFLGAAVNWDLGETGDAGNNYESVSATIDATFKMAGLSAYGAFAYNNFASDEANIATIVDDEVASLDRTIETLGYMFQVGYMVIPDKLEPFARYEYVKFDDPSVTNNEVNILTGGMNYYFKGHAAKFSLDVVWVMDPLDGSNLASARGAEGLGLLPDTKNDDQIAVRAQFQLLF